MKNFLVRSTAITLMVVFCFASAVTSDTAVDKAVASQTALLETWIDELMAYYHIPGVAVGIVHDQDLIWAKGFGYADLEKRIPVTPKTLFRIASVTKLFTSTAIVQLRDQGKLRLDDPIKKYLPWFEIRNRFEDVPDVTIRQLLTHTSGLPREATFPYWTDHVFPEIEQIVEALPEQEMIFAPETRWKYSNLGMALLGEVVSAVSGQTYEEYVIENILEPLQMSSTRVSLFEEDMPRLATGYLRYKPDRAREVAPFTESNGLTPAANISSNVEDLARFCSLQFKYEGKNDSQILKGSTLREMHRVHWLQPSWKSGYGLGFSVRREGERVLVGHGGWIAGYRTQLLFAPEDKVGAIVMINTEDFSPNTIAQRAIDLVAPVIRKAVKPDTAQYVFDPEWQKYVGKYEDPTYWQTDVLIHNDRLYLYGHGYPPDEDPSEGLIELFPEGPDTFRRSGPNGDGERVVFEMDKRGRVKRVKIGENYVYPVDMK